MRKLILICGLILLILTSYALAAEEKWVIEKSAHFIIYYKNASEDFIRQVKERAEEYYTKIADDLGFRKFNFWLWDNRASIYIHDDANGFQAYTGQPAWAIGATLPQDKIIHSFIDAKGFFDATLRHEMAHVIFREFVGFDNYGVPLWLDEGVASYQGNYSPAGINRIIKKAMTDNKFIKLEDLAGFNPLAAQDTDSVGIFYSEATSIVDCLIREFGKEDFVSFCQALRDKKDLVDALYSVYSLGSLSELSQTWAKYINQN